MPAVLQKGQRNQSMECAKMVASFFVVLIHVAFPGTLGAGSRLPWGNCLGTDRLAAETEESDPGIIYLDPEACRFGIFSRFPAGNKPPDSASADQKLGAQPRKKPRNNADGHHHRKIHQ